MWVWRWKTWINYLSCLISTDWSTSVKNMPNEVPDCFAWGGLLVVKRFISVQSHWDTPAQHDLSESLTFEERRSITMQDEMPVRIETKDGLNVFHANEPTRCSTSSCPLFEVWLWHESRVYHKLNVEPKTNKSRTSEWHLETTDYAGQFHSSLLDIQLLALKNTWWGQCFRFENDFFHIFYVAVPQN